MFRLENTQLPYVNAKKSQKKQFSANNPKQLQKQSNKLNAWPQQLCSWLQEKGSSCRQSHTLLTLIFTTTIFVGGLAHFIGT